jgi:hypothetical protein
MRTRRERENTKTERGRKEERTKTEECIKSTKVHISHHRT